MKALRRTSVLLLLLVLTQPSAKAMPGAGGTVGQGASAFSLPLPSADLPQGELTVKVVGEGMNDLKVGQRVLLQQLTDRGTGAEQVSQTEADGRARFKGLTQDKQYRLVVEIEGQAHRSPPFAGPETGGLRLLFSLKSDRQAAHPSLPQGKNGPVAGPEDPHQGMGDPHGQNPHLGQEKQGAALVEPAPDLKVGEVRVQVSKGLKKTPVAGAEVKIMGQDAQLWRTDLNGTILITPQSQEGKVPPLLVVFGELTYRSRSLELPDKGGLRVTFTVFDRTKSPAQIALGRGSHLVCQVGEGAINVMQVFELVNAGEEIFDPGAKGHVLPLPLKAVHVEIPVEFKEFLSYEAGPPRLRLLAPVTPGSTVLRVFYELHYQGGEVDVQQSMTLPASESVLMVVNNDRVNILGPSVQSARDFTPEKRQERIFGLAPVKKGAMLEFTLTDLPHRDLRLIHAAIAIAGIIMLWGILAAWAGPRWAAQRIALREERLHMLIQLDRTAKKSVQDQKRREELMHALRRDWNA